MKRNILYILFGLAMIFVSSCNKFLDAPNQSSFAEDVIFSDATLAEGAVMGVYDLFGADKSYRNRLGLYMAINTDIELHSNSLSGASSNTRTGLAVYNLRSDNTEMNATQGTDPFSRVYAAIERVNICIKGIREYGSPAVSNKMGYLLGEALTLRALLYGDLIKWWGDVPARFEPVTSATIYLPKTDRDIIYKQIISDLSEAEQFVPWPGESIETSTVERVNKAFVKGLKARLCLAAAGYSMRKDGIRLSTDPELEKSKMYTIARQECLDIIESKKCKLETSFEKIFKDNCQDVITTGRESVFEIPYSDTRGQMLSYCGLRHENVLENVDKYATINIKGEIGAAPTLFYDYNENDVRRDVTVSPYKWSYGKQLLSSVNQWYFGKYRAEWMTRIPVTSNDEGINQIILRYADILLMFAEAENELNGPTSSAKTYLKEVRYRAFPSSLHANYVDEYVDGLTEKSAFFQALVKERALEFAGEQLRKFDLIRWNLLKAKMDELKSNIKKLRNGEEPYGNIPKYLFWKYNPDNTTIKIYGLNPGEIPKDTQGNPLPEGQWDNWKSSFDGGGWNDFTDSQGVSKSWINGTETTGDLKDSWIDGSVYVVNPDTRQLFPIMNCILVNSNGMLENDYGY